MRNSVSKLIISTIALLMLFVLVGSSNPALANENISSFENAINNHDFDSSYDAFGGDSSTFEVDSQLVPASSSDEQYIIRDSNAGMIEPFDIIGPTYPGTNISMKAGDVLYSTKTLGGSSQVVGHVGIVNADFNVVHATKYVDNGSGGTVDDITYYRSRHTEIGSGEEIKILRPRNGLGVQAAKWATNNYYKVTQYQIKVWSPFNEINPNYCSKFIWQAFRIGDNVDITGQNMSINSTGFIAPSQFYGGSQYFVNMGSFKA